MSLSGKVAKNTLIQLIGKVVSTALGLLSLALITRYLGQSGYGQYTTILNFLTIFAVFADFGLTLVTVQMISGINDEKKESGILSNILGFRLISILLFLAISPLVLFFVPYSQNIKTGILLSAPYFIFPALSQVIIGLLQKRLKMGRAVLAEVLSRIILIASIAIVWYFQAGLNGIILATVVSGASSFIFHYIFASKLAHLRLSFDFSLWKEIIKRSWPLAITIALNLLYLRTDIVFLSIFRSDGEVGLYGAAYKVIDVLTTIPFMFAGLILPIISTAWIEKRSHYFKNVLQKSFNFMAISALPLVAGGVLLSEPIMVAVAGNEFAGSGPLLSLLIIAVGFIFLGTVFSHAVIAVDKQKKLIPYYLFTSVTSIIGYLILIPRYSGFGAAGITIYSEALVAIFSGYFVFKYSGFYPKLKIFLKALLATLAMSLIIIYAPDNFKTGYLGLIGLIFFSSIVYGLVLFALGGIDINDIKTIFKKSKKSTVINPINEI